MSNIKYIYAITLITLTLVFSSCNKKSEFESITDVPERTWKADSITTFNFDIVEEGNFDVYYIVKNQLSYDYYNLYLKTYFKDDKNLIADRLQEVVLFHPKTGKPYGKGLGGTMEHQFLAFPKQKLAKGNHTISVQQYMRVAELKGILAIGIKVVKSE